MIDQRQQETNPITIKPETEPRGGAVLPGSLTLLLSAWVPLPDKVSRFVSTRVSSDNSFLSFRQEPTLGPWKGSPFLQLSGIMKPPVILKKQVLSRQLCRTSTVGTVG